MKKFFKKIGIFIKKNLTIFIVIFMFLFLVVCDKTSFFVGDFIMDNLKTIATNFTPTTDLFDDGSEVKFVSYFFGMKVNKKGEEPCVYHMPSYSQNLSNSQENLVFCYDGVVNSVAGGTVVFVGYNKDGIKCIEIEHTDGVVSRYDGIETVGVIQGESVLASKPIGVCSTKQNLKISFLKNSSNLKISDIQWKN